MSAVEQALFMEQMEVRKLSAFTFLIPKGQVKGYDIEVTVEYTQKGDDEKMIAANAWVRAGDGYVKGFVATVFVPVSDDPVESILLELGKEPSFADEAIRFIETIDGPGL